MNIKEAEIRTGITKQNIRFYEKKGLLHPGRGAENNYRDYTEEDIETLKQIRILRRLDISIEDIRRILNGETNRNSVIQSHLDALEEKRSSLDAAIRICRFLLKQEGENMDADEVLGKMDDLEKQGGYFRSIIDDYKKVSQAEYSQNFTICFSDHVSTPAEFTEALFQYADEKDLNLVVTEEGMHPVFEIDGLEYTAHLKKGLLGKSIICEVTHREWMGDKDISPERKSFFRIFIWYLSTLLTCLVSGVFAYFVLGDASVFLWQTVGFLTYLLVRYRRFRTD